METQIQKPLRDKTGREILPGDVLKVFHFIGARRKRHYTYKFVTGGKTIGGHRFMRISHLACDPEESYFELIDGRIMIDVEIVQGFGGGESFEDRPRDLTEGAER